MARATYLLSIGLLGAYAIGVGAYPAYDWIGFFAAMCVLFSALLSGQLPIPNVGMLAGGALVLAGGAITAVSLRLPTTSLVAALLFAYVFAVWIPLGGVLFRRRQQLWLLFAALSLSMAATSLAALAQLFGASIPGTEPVWGRMTGLTRHPNELGTFCGMGLPLALYLVVSAKGIVCRAAWAVVLVLSLIGLVLSVSLTGLLAASVATLSFLVISKERGRLYIIIMVGIVMAAWLSFEYLGVLGALTLAERISDLGQSGVESSTLWTRLLADQAALASIANRPLIGVGFNQTVANVSTLVHNAPLRAWYEGGLFALIGMLIALLSAVFELVNAYRLVVSKFAAEYRQAFAAVTGSFAALLVTLSVSPTLFQRSSWFPVIAVLALGATIRAETSSRIRTATVSSAAHA